MERSENPDAEQRCHLQITTHRIHNDKLRCNNKQL